MKRNELKVLKQNEIEADDFQFMEVTETKLGGALIKYRFKIQEVEREKRSMLDLFVGIKDMFLNNIKLHKSFVELQKLLKQERQERDRERKRYEKEIKGLNTKLGWLESWRMRRRAKWEKWLKKRIRAQVKLTKLRSKK